MYCTILCLCRCGQYVRWDQSQRNWLLTILYSLDRECWMPFSRMVNTHTHTHTNFYLLVHQFLLPFYLPFSCFSLHNVLSPFPLSFTLTPSHPPLLMSSQMCPGRNHCNPWCLWLWQNCHITITLQILQFWCHYLCRMWRERKWNVWSIERFPRGKLLSTFRCNDRNTIAGSIHTLIL